MLQIKPYFILNNVICYILPYYTMVYVRKQYTCYTWFSISHKYVIVHNVNKKDVLGVSLSLKANSEIWLT